MSINVEVPLQGPEELVSVAGRGDDLKADVPQRVEDDDAAALETNPVRRIPSGLFFHPFRKFTLKYRKEGNGFNIIDVIMKCWQSRGQS